MNSIYLVRHGDYDNPRNILPGRLPVELSSLGKEQSKKLHTFFKGKKFTSERISFFQPSKRTRWREFS